jgi:hypothetical protein
MGSRDDATKSSRDDLRRHEVIMTRVENAEKTYHKWFLHDYFIFITINRFIGCPSVRTWAGQHSPPRNFRHCTWRDLSLPAQQWCHIQQQQLLSQHQHVRRLSSPLVSTLFYHNVTRCCHSKPYKTTAVSSHSNSHSQCYISPLCAMRD